MGDRHKIWVASRALLASSMLVLSGCRVNLPFTLDTTSATSGANQRSSTAPQNPDTAEAVLSKLTVKGHAPKTGYARADSA